MTKTLHPPLIASRWFWRALKKGDWFWLLVALFIASSTVTLIKHLSDSITTSMERKAAMSLQADLVLQSTRPIDEKWLTLAEENNIQHRTVTSTVTMALANDQFQLVRLKGVSQAQPLRGQVQFQQTQDFAEEPLSNENVWVQTKLATLLNLQPNQKILLGERYFTVSSLIAPTVILNPANQFAPEITLRLDQLESTQLIGAGSRVNYRFEFAGTPKAIEYLHTQLKTEIQPNLQILTASSASNDLGKALERAQLFLDLSALATVLIAGMSILIASRFYLGRWQKTLVMLRSIGANDTQLSSIFKWQLMWLALVSSAIGATAGVLLSYLLTPVMGDFFDPWLPASYLHAWGLGVLTGTIVLWSFTWKILQDVLRDSPYSLIRKTANQQQLIKQSLISLALLMTLMFLLVEVQYVLTIISALSMLMVLLFVGAHLILWLLKRLNRSSQGWFRIAISNVLRQPSLLNLQIISLGVVLFALILMTLLRQDLLKDWKSSLPQQAPNHFLINIQPGQLDDVKKALSQKIDLNDLNLYAMARGRLTHINQQEIVPDDIESMRGKRLLAREANNAISNNIPNHNPVLQQINIDASIPNVTVESEIAELFGIKLGDVLSFDFAGQRFDFTTSAIREVRWQSFELNFFFILSKHYFNDLPISYIGNFYLPETMSSTDLTQQLAQQSSGVILFDVRQIIQQIEDIMSQASLAVSWLYLFTLLASIAVVFSATLASQQERIQNWMLLRTLGASSADILKIGLSEFALLGSAAGLLAASFAQITSWVISVWLLDLPASFNAGLWLTSLSVGALIVLTIGWLTQRHYLKLSAHQLKRYV